MTLKTKWIPRVDKKTNNCEENKKNLKEGLITSFGLSNRVAELFINRGCTSIEEGRRYLMPSLEDLHDPFLFEDMEKVVERIISARTKKEKICLYGDYDADGTIGISILLKFMKSQNFNIGFFIPNRLKDGYGLHFKSLENIIDTGVKLIITIDNGISAIEQIDYCNSKKVDVIVTDHHECHGNSPKAFGIINPKRPGSTYPFKELCGAGVVLKLIQAIAERLETTLDLQESIECVALATVADLVPIQNENRTLVSMGLNYLNTSPKNSGIRVLMATSDIKKIKAWHLGFILGPKINAAGRLGDANQIVELLTESDPQKLLFLAEFLSEENRKRQELEKKIFDEALILVETKRLFADDVMVVFEEGWHSGVIGIVASRLQEIYYGPVIVIGVENEIAKGSCRSVEGFNIFEAISSCGHLFISFGGHALAAGFTMLTKNIKEMREALNNYGQLVNLKDCLVKKIYYDSVIRTEEITWELLNEIELFEPCGIGNPGIQFMLNNPKIESGGTMGKDNSHLYFNFHGFRGVGFGLGDFLSEIPEISVGNQTGIGLICRLDSNMFRGEKLLQLSIRDIKRNPIWDLKKAMVLLKLILKDENSKEELETILEGVFIGVLELNRETTILVYGLIKKYGEQGIPLQKVGAVYKDISPFHFLMTCEILREAGLIAYKLQNQTAFFNLIHTDKKKDIQKTKLMIKLKSILNSIEGE